MSIHTVTTGPVVEACASEKAHLYCPRVFSVGGSTSEETTSSLPVTMRFLRIKGCSLQAVSCLK